MPNKKNKKTIKSLNIEIDYGIVISIFLIVIYSVLFIYAKDKALTRVSKEVININEKSYIDYKVYLKDNSFYDKPYLDKNMAYVDSLIDKIKIDFDYSLNTSVESNLDIRYRVIAKLVIASQNNSNIFYEKEYDLTKLIIDEMVNKKEYTIHRDVVIDYHYYNNLANTFRSDYAVNTSSRLDIALIVDEVNKKNSNYKLSNSSVTTLSIPLSEQEISINLDDRQINKSQTITKNSKLIVKDILFLVIYITSIIMIIALMIYLIIRVIKIINNRTNKLSKYDKYIKRLLIGYDRIIVNVKTAPKKNKYNVIDVENFQELIDVRDNTKEHINYYIIKEHEKCEFFVINDDELYLIVFDAKDFDRKSNHEK